MSTVIGFECDGGAVLAGDRTLVRSGSIASRSTDHVFEFGDVGAAVVGSPGGLEEFERELDAELREYRTERGEPSIDAVERIASEVTQSAGVDAIVAVRDDDGVARVRAVSSDGSVLRDPVAALGSGSELALGRLEGADRDVPPDNGESLAREILETVAERDTETGDDVDLWRLEDASE